MSALSQRSNAERVTDPEAPAIVAVATGLAQSVHTLMPACSAGVVVAVGSEWQLLAQRGSTDIASSWRASLAERVRDSDRGEQDSSHLVAPFAAVQSHVLLVLVAEPGGQLPRRAYRTLRPVLDEGGVLLDRAVAAQRRDRAIRRVLLACRERDGHPLRTIDDLEDALSALWPNATAHFHKTTDLARAPRAARRLLRSACDRDQPTVGSTPTGNGLLPPTLRCQVAIPLPSRGGAILVESSAGGEEPDMDSVATALGVARGTGCVRTGAVRLAGSV
jgi:hypothetical protein